MGKQEILRKEIWIWAVFGTQPFGLLGPRTPPPLCGIPSRCCFFTGPWTVTRSSLRMLRRVAAFCRPLRPPPLRRTLPPPPPPAGHAELFSKTLGGGEGLPLRLSQCAGRHFPVFALVWGLGRTLCALLSPVRRGAMRVGWASLLPPGGPRSPEGTATAEAPPPLAALAE